MRSLAIDLAALPWIVRLAAAQTVLLSDDPAGGPEPPPDLLSHRHPRL